MRVRMSAGSDRNSCLSSVYPGDVPSRYAQIAIIDLK